MANHSATAEALFKLGYNCAQATAAAFAEDFGLETSFVLKSMAGFGAGMGGLRESCGAISAMVYLAGLHIGTYPPDDLTTKTALYDLVEKMVREFTGRHGTTSCRELLEESRLLALAQSFGTNRGILRGTPMRPNRRIGGGDHLEQTAAAALRALGVAARRLPQDVP